MDSVDASDSHWFPVDLDVQGGRLHFLRLDESVIARASFLDNRMPIEASVVTSLSLEDLRSEMRAPQPAPAWLWHTSFCGSTLMARMLHVAPHSISLREPLILRRLSDAADAGMKIGDFIQPVIRLLARPWHAGGRVVIKPTHAALNIANVLMESSEGGRAVVMTSSLDDFLVSHLKKTSDTLTKTLVLAHRSLRATGDFRHRLAPAAFNPPDPLAAAALQWAAQRELVAALRDRFGDRIKVLHWERVQEDPVAAALEASDWLQLAVPVERMESHALAEAATHAKVPGRSYSPQERSAENEWLRGRYSEPLTQAKSWADLHVLPRMRFEALEM
jgi:hypothetical protein